MVAYLQPNPYQLKTKDISMDWFLYDNDLRHERVNEFFCLLRLGPFKKEKRFLLNTDVLLHRVIV